MNNKNNKDHERVAERGRADELLTIGEVADIVRVPIATLRYWRPPRHRSPQLPHRPRSALLAQRSHHLAAKPKRRPHRRRVPVKSAARGNLTRGNVSTRT